MNRSLQRVLPVLDILATPLVYAAACLLRLVRHTGVQRLPMCKATLMRVGVFPIRDHYYEPQFIYTPGTQPFSQERSLPGIDWNENEQLQLLATFSFSHELENIPYKKPAPIDFYFNNQSFESGDAEYWYQLIRSVKPKRIFEIGSGNSTLMAIKAIRANQKQDASYRCKHVCIEPYEMAWLEQQNVTVLRQKVETVDLKFFSELEENDILFVDSSHMIKPQGDVLTEYLELLPSLGEGVIVHAHDIFSPRDYPAQWITGDVLFWNEQYLLEAFLSHNTEWKIVGALNYLHHHHYDKLRAVAPHLTPDRDPGSFYIQRKRTP